MRTETVKLHDNKVLWADMKSLAEVLHLKDTTPEHIWETTYQGNPVSPKGKIFKREWFSSRFDIRESNKKPVARFISLDTALSDTEGSAYSAATVGDLMSDYSLRVIYSWADKVQFPQLVDQTTDLALRFRNHPTQHDLLKGIIVEKKVSGFSLIQVLRQSTDNWIRGLVKGITPKGDKNQRLSQASVWCSNSMVQLPIVCDEASWLYDFEDDLFAAPDIPYMDRMDSFSQLVIYLSHYLSQGYDHRQGRYK